MHVKKKGFHYYLPWILAAAAVTAVLAAAAVFLLPKLTGGSADSAAEQQAEAETPTGESGPESTEPVPEDTEAVSGDTEPAPEDTEPAPEETEPAAEPAETAAAEQTEVWITLLGDCVLGGEGTGGAFVTTVGENYELPFAKVSEYLQADDLTFANLEGVLSMEGSKQTKDYNFRAPSEYAQCLSVGGVEVVTLANNHSYDYGADGYQGTKDALEQYGVQYVEEEGTLLYTTESGIVIGIYTECYPQSADKTVAAVGKLKDAGAQIILCTYYWGTEKSYTPTTLQKTVAHAAIDAGADIVYGTHPHVLQPMETYEDGVIFYSMANFCYGGNRHPYDMDTALVQQQILVNADGTVTLGMTGIVPCRVSGDSSLNDYQPTPCEQGSTEYSRILSKLDGTYAKISGDASYGNPTQEQYETYMTEKKEAEKRAVYTEVVLKGIAQALGLETEETEVNETEADGISSGAADTADASAETETADTAETPERGTEAAAGTDTQ